MSAADFDQDVLIEQIIQELDDKDLVVNGDEWWVEQTADPYEFTVATYEDERTVMRKLRVRLSVQVTEVTL
jgi:hypothetical protein